MSRWSEEQVLAAAPDARSASAGRALAVPGPWTETGSNDSLVWGRCQGSGKNPYQVSVDLDAPAYRCSCPSRKFPCKHAIALLLLWARGATGDDQDVAAFAADWAEKRTAKAEQKTREAAPADPEARAQRLEQRFRKMDAGIDDLTVWLTDLARSGLAEARSQPYAFWDRTAARLVDAQLSGLADRVRTMGEESLRRADWADYLLGQTGRLWLLAQAWRRRDDLTEDDQADLRAAVGLPTPTEQVRAGQTRSEIWQVMGAHRSVDGPLQQQRTWLRADDGEFGLLLETAAPGQSLGVPQLAGARLRATLGFYPGNTPRRVLFVDDPEPMGEASSLGEGTSVAEALRRSGESLAAAPWRTRFPVTLSHMRIALDPAAAVDANGDALALADGIALDLLLARTGGRACDLFGELEDGLLRVLAINVDGSVIPL